MNLRGAVSVGWGKLGESGPTSTKGDEIPHHVWVNVTQPALWDELLGVGVDGMVGVHEVGGHAYGFL